MKNTVPAVGARSSIAIGEELVWGVPVDPTHLIEFTSESLTAEEEELQSEGIRGDRGRHQLIRGRLTISGDINYEQAASGFGMLIRHALGDYIQIGRVDGGAHARVESALEGGDPLHIETDNDGEIVILPLSKDHSGGFPEAGRFVVVDRSGAGGTLAVQGGGVGFEYETYTLSAMSHADSVQDETDAAYTNDVVTVTVYPELGPEGQYVRPSFNPNGGLIEYGHRRRRAKYYKATDEDVTIDGNNEPGVKLFMDPEDVAVGDIAAGDFIFGFAGFALTGATVDNFDDGTGAGPTLKRGSWIYEFDEDFDGVYTHHIERGRFLPEGLTIEVDRDAAVFLYSGVQVDTLTITADANAIVEGSVGLVGRAEYAMAELVEDVLPGVAGQSRDYILVKGAEAFPNPDDRPDMDEAILTIGERTNIRYNKKELAGPGDGIGYEPADDVWKLTLVDKTEVVSFHPKGSNVDCRTSRRIENIVKGDNTPLTAFESVIYIDGTYEEVLSAEVTLNNNINTDKMGLGSRSPLAVVAEVAEVDATLSMEFDDGKHYKRFINGDFFYLELKCISESADALIGETGIPAQMYVILPRCKFNGETPNVADRSFIEHDMPITAVVDNDYDTTDLVIILVNGLQEDVEKSP